MSIMVVLIGSLYLLNIFLFFLTHLKVPSAPTTSAIPGAVTISKHQFWDIAAFLAASTTTPATSPQGLSNHSEELCGCTALDLILMCWMLETRMRYFLSFIQIFLFRWVIWSINSLVAFTGCHLSKQIASRRANFFCQNTSISQPSFLETLTIFTVVLCDDALYDHHMQKSCRDSKSPYLSRSFSKAKHMEPIGIY